MKKQRFKISDIVTLKEDYNFEIDNEVDNCIHVIITKGTKGRIIGVHELGIYDGIECMTYTVFFDADVKMTLLMGDIRFE